MKMFLVSFVIDEYDFNERELLTKNGGRCLVLNVKAKNAEAAYLIGVEKARQATNRTFRLNLCRAVFDNPPPSSESTIDSDDNDVGRYIRHAI